MPELNHRPEVKAFLDDLLIGMPGVKAGKSWGYPSYKINGKIFAFVGGEGIALKLPVERVQELVAQGGCVRAFEVAEGIVWKAWVSIDRADPNDYEQDMPLFEESIAFVLGA
jgi:hypothetical protein